MRLSLRLSDLLPPPHAHAFPVRWIGFVMSVGPQFPMRYEPICILRWPAASTIGHTDDADAV